MWKDWLALSKREQKGFIVLSVILFLLIVFYSAIPFLFTANKEDKPDRELQAWIDSMKKLNILPVTQNDSFFYFDPNTVKISELEKLGIKGDALINWLKFRECGQKFKKPEDILKVYSLDSALGQTLIKYVRFKPVSAKKDDRQKSRHVSPTDRTSISGTGSLKGNPSKIKEKNTPLVIEINSADTADFALLKGIGEVLSARIISYRKALGGYYSTHQLKEVYGMPAETIDKNITNFSVDTTLIKRINVNKASLRKLKSHPYIDFYLAKAIVEYRRKNGQVNNINDILSLKEVKSRNREKLKHYLTIK